MGEATGNDTTEHALAVVGGIVGHRSEIPTKRTVSDAENDGGGTHLASHFPDGEEDIIVRSLGLKQLVEGLSQVRNWFKREMELVEVVKGEQRAEQGGRRKTTDPGPTQSVANHRAHASERITRLPHALLHLPDSSMAVPRLILIDRPKDTPHGRRSPLCAAWVAAVDEYLSDLPIKSNITILEGSLTDLPVEQVQCDCLVSPANSFGIMDGGYALGSDAVARA